MKKVIVRKAHIRDAKEIHELVNRFASADLMMPRSLNEIFECIRDYWVAVDVRKKFLGCSALHVVGWEHLAEVKSLAVKKEEQGKGIGRLLIEASLVEAKTLRVRRIFALTYQPGFFKKFGFKIISKSKLPHKIWAECCDCPKFPKCTETALIKTIA